MCHPRIAFPSSLLLRIRICLFTNSMMPSCSKLAKVRIEIVAPDEVAEVIFQRVTEVAQTGHFGDGLVWITEVEKVAFVFKTTQGAE